MKVSVNFEGILIGAKESEYKRQDGGVGKTYSLAVEVNDEAGNLPCDEKVYASVRNGMFSKYSFCRFYAVYDSQYKNLKLFDVGFAEKKGK